MVLYDPNEPNGLEGAWDMDRRVVARGLSLGGTCSGEHGIGLGKRDFLEAEHGADALDVMRSLKVAPRPARDHDPGKMFRN
jgi:D-lactate dehydrogenase (cytochrome)